MSRGKANGALGIDFLEDADEGFGDGFHIGRARERPRSNRGPGAIEIIGDLIAHNRSLLLNLAGERAWLERSFIDDDAERRLQGMSEIADLSASALDHCAIGANEKI